MKYPNPTFLKTAQKVKHTRRNRTIAAIAVLCFLTLAVLFILKMANMQKKYKKDYPQLVGMATATTTTKETTETTTKETTTETSEETTETEVQELVPSFTEVTTTTEETEATTTVQNNAPDVFKEAENNFYFKNEHPLQIVSHDVRDQGLDDLKEDLESYISDYTTEDERVCFYYANLSNNETMGVNELDPMIPASAYNLPIATIYFNLTNASIINPNSEVTYTSPAGGNSSYISTNYEPGKRFTLRTLVHYALVYNDNTALDMLLSKMGGIDSTVAHVNKISCYIDYSKTVLYFGANNQQFKGKYRSSCYDMVKYAENLYRSYMNDPSQYQPFVNDLSVSEVPTSFATAFGSDALILHCAGKNETCRAYTDVAIIDDCEPIAVCVYCECSSSDRAAVITADLSTLLQRYLDSLH